MQKLFNKFREFLKESEKNNNSFLYKVKEKINEKDKIFLTSKPFKKFGKIKQKMIKSKAFTYDKASDKFVGVGLIMPLKPLGLWYACGEEWLDVFSEKMPNWKSKYKYVYKLDIDFSNILKIFGSDEFKKFELKYSLKSTKGREGEKIDWFKVAEDYKGIEICPYLPEYRTESLWYYGWDIASGCIWDGSCIRKVELISQKDQ